MGCALTSTSLFDATALRQRLRGKLDPWAATFRWITSRSVQRDRRVGRFSVGEFQPERFALHRDETFVFAPVPPYSLAP